MVRQFAPPYWDQLFLNGGFIFLFFYLRGPRAYCLNDGGFFEEIGMEVEVVLGGYY